MSRLARIVGGAVVAALALTSLTGIPAAAAGVATISGTVGTEYWNEAIEGSTVALFGADDATPIATADVIEGGFTLEVAAAGDYRVKASAPGFDSRWWETASSYAEATVIPVTDGDVPGIAIELVAETYSLTGTVTAGNPAVPVEGVGVEVLGEFGGYTDVVTTDASGAYEISGLPDRGFVHFIATAGLASEWFDDVPDEESAKLITFDANRTADAVLAQAGTISGTIRGKAGSQAAEPLAGAHATLYTVNGSTITSVEAADDGTYVFDGVAAGSYRIGFSSGDWPRSWKSVYYGGSARMSFGTVVSLTSTSGLTGVDATLTPVSSIGGTVFNGATGEPIDTAHLTLRTLNGEILDDAWTSSGTYLFRDLAPGAYTVHVYDSGDEAGTWFGGGHSHVAATPIVVKAGASNLAKNITLVPAGHLSGRVVAPGASTFLTQVTLLTPKGQEVMSRYVYENAYSFSGIRPGQYLVRFDPPAGRVHGEWWGDASTRQAATRVQIAAGEETILGEAELDVDEAGQISGRVVGGENRGVSVYGPTLDTPRDVTVGSNETFLVTGLAPGTFTIRYSDGQATDRVTVKSGVTTVAPTVTLRNSVYVGVTTTALDAPTEAFATFFTLDGTEIDSMATDWDGSGSITLPADRYRVRFASTDPERDQGIVWLGGASKFSTSTVLDLRSIGETAISAELPRGSSFTGRVTDSKRRAINGIGVIAWELRPDGSYDRANRESSTNLAGRFAVANLGAGTYKFQFEDGAYRTTWYGGTSLARARPITYTVSPAPIVAKLVTELLPYYGTVAVTAPTISGTMAVGKKLTAKSALVWPASGVTTTYRWYRNGAPISGATKSAYALKRADAGKEITVRLAGKRTGYTSSGTTSLPRNTRD